MPARREKTLHYRRAQWLQIGQTLESYTRQACQTLPTVDLRTIERGEGKFVRCIRTRRRQQGGIFLHLTADTPGEAASTIPKLLNQADVDVGEAGPPQDAEFMDGDAFVFIRDDHVCFCAGELRDASIAYFLASLFLKADLGGASSQFVLNRVADVEKIQLIQERGVKEIVLDASLYEATAHYNARNAQPASVLRSIGRTFWSLLAHDDNDDRDDNLQVQVSIAADGRVRHNAEFGYRRLEALAEKVVENERAGDQYAIITKDNQKITAGEITLHKTARITAFGKSVSRDPAWNELLAYYQELAAAHLLEQ